MTDTEKGRDRATSYVLVFGEISVMPSDPGVTFTSDPTQPIELIAVLPESADPFPVLADYDLLLTPILDLEAGLARVDIRDYVQPMYRGTVMRQRVALVMRPS